MNLNSSHGVVVENFCALFSKEPHDTNQTSSFEEGVKLLAEDTCKHCAEHGLELAARQAKVHETTNRSSPSITYRLGQFQSFTNSSCEFQFSFSVFLPVPSECSNTDIVQTPIKLSVNPPELPQGCRMRLRLNDHLRGEEGVRGWLLIVEGNTIETLFEAIDAVNLSAPQWDVWKNGTFSKS
ncbi:hypothetical protein PHET_01921 [Paragonimus heterotremus]|uniref:Uncharacterized protein n=1 Tax=Paragonimus heterotremus TaxID=100268 RepID=A0A8J4T2P5_9TREM|nr:hypothetical protein PHET_01921 [Paragonimus heterotremus]